MRWHPQRLCRELQLCSQRNLAMSSTRHNHCRSSAGILGKQASRSSKYLCITTWLTHLWLLLSHPHAMAPCADSCETLLYAAQDDSLSRFHRRGALCALHKISQGAAGAIRLGAAQDRGRSGDRVSGHAASIVGICAGVEVICIFYAATASVAYMPHVQGCED